MVPRHDDAGFALDHRDVIGLRRLPLFPVVERRAGDAEKVGELLFRHPAIGAEAFELTAPISAATLRAAPAVYR